MDLTKTIPYSVITKAIENEVLDGDTPWFQSKEDFENWAADVLDCIIFKILDTLGLDFDTEKWYNKHINKRKEWVIWEE